MKPLAQGESVLSNGSLIILAIIHTSNAHCKKTADLPCALCNTALAERRFCAHRLSDSLTVLVRGSTNYGPRFRFDTKCRGRHRISTRVSQMFGSASCQKIRSYSFLPNNPPVSLETETELRERVPVSLHIPVVTIENPSLNAITHGGKTTCSITQPVQCVYRLRTIIRMNNFHYIPKQRKPTDRCHRDALIFRLA